MGRCKHGQCLQCAIQAGEYWNPILPDAHGITEMSQAAVYLREMEEAPNKLGLDKNWPAQVAAAMEVMQSMEHGGFKSLTHWRHPYMWETGFSISIGTSHMRVYESACTSSKSKAAWSTGAGTSGMQQTKSTLQPIDHNV